MGMIFAMFVILVAMLVTLALAGLVVAYVAFIQQGRDIPQAVPRADWLTKTLRRLADRWQAVADPADRPDEERDLHIRRGGLRRTPDH